MAEDKLKQAGVEARSELTDITQINVGSQRRSGIWIPNGNLEGSQSRTAEAEGVPLSACDMDGRTFTDQQNLDYNLAVRGSNHAMICG
jgi:hypothetical protein